MASANVSRGESSLDDNFSLVTGEAGPGQVASASGSGAQRDPRPSSEGSEKAGLAANYKIPIRLVGPGRVNHGRIVNQIQVNWMLPFMAFRMHQGMFLIIVGLHSIRTLVSSSDESSLPVKRIERRLRGLLGKRELQTVLIRRALLQSRKHAGNVLIPL